ncbi:MAG TPA: PKD domain-containing protein [Gemmatimonadaceae bacterium]|nr:PKD domain-containing protein [Gemmatimonadaceae bacterium]
MALIDSATGKTVDRLITDLSGRFTFWGVRPGVYRICWSKTGFVTGCFSRYVPVTTLPVTLGWISVSVEPKGQSTAVYGSVNMRGGNLRTFVPMIGVNSYARVYLVDLNGATLDSAYVNNYGDYVLPRVPTNRMLRLDARVEGARVERTMVPEFLASSGIHQVNLTFINYLPRFTNVLASIGGARVRTAAPGATIALSASAGDADGDPVSYNWRVLQGGGTLSAKTGANVSWTLPNQPGLFRVDVVAADGRGGYARQYTLVSTAGNGVAFSGHVNESNVPALQGAEVEVNGVRTTTSASGYFQVRVHESSRYVFNVRKPGYKLLSQIYQDAVEGGAWTLTKGTVQTVDPTQPIDVTDGRKFQRCGTILTRIRFDSGSVALRPVREDENGYVIQARKDREPVRNRENPRTPCGPGMRLQIPANSLADANGNAPSGPVNVTLYTTDLRTPFDMPGDYTVLDAGSTKVMESYGAGHIQITQGGTTYNLKSGATATLTLPIDPVQLASSDPKPSTIPLLTYDEKNGVWLPDGTLTRSGNNYVGTIKHLSDFNSDLVKTNQACIRIFSGDPGAGLTPLPAQYNIEITVPLGTAAPRFFSRLVANTAPNFHAFYNLPTNTDVTMAVYSTDPPPNTKLYGTFVVNTGGPQNPTSPNQPAPNYGACQGSVVLFDATQPVPGVDAFLHGLYSFEAANLTELAISNPALEAQFETASANYYQQIDPRGLRSTYAAFLSKHGFQPGNHDSATYVNAVDLAFGREMHCKRTPASDGLAEDIACYVTNYGQANGSNADDDADFINTANRTNAFATVAMEYSRIENPSGDANEFDPNDHDRVVKFYVYNQPAGALVTKADLDGRGARPVPQLCMVCHGGEYPSGFAQGVPTFNNKASVKMGSVFIPFDLRALRIVDGVVVNGATPYDKANQQAAFKALNQTHVLGTSPGAAITDMINNMYTGAATVQSENYVVSGWQANAGQQAMYTNVVAASCRMCHASRPEPAVAPFGLDLRFASASAFTGLGGSVPSRVCTQRVMPHALATYNRFWQSLNPHQPGQLKAFGDAQVTGGYGNDCVTFVGTPPSPPGVVTFGPDVQPILSSNCAFSGCHAGASPKAGLDMSAGVAYGNLVNRLATELGSMNRVTPGNTAQSYLIHKLNGTQVAAGGSGVRMPPGGPLSAAELQIIIKWVQDGAPP